ncbi:MAG: TldD/PmbA family protein, partial [Candidatus Bathyarchaeota archaeon]
MSDLLEKTETLVKKAKNLGADEAIAKTTFGKRVQIRFSNNEIDISKVWKTYLTEVTLTWEKRVVATDIRDFERAEERIEDLFKLAKVSQPNPMYGGIASGEFKYDKSSADLGIMKLEDPTIYVEKAIEAARVEVPRGLYAGGTLYTNYEDVYLYSSEGPEGRDSRSSIELSIRAFSQNEASGHGIECSSSLANFKSERAGKKAGEIAWLARDPVAGEEGKFDVIFDPLFTGSLLGTYGMMASAFYVMIQMSVFGGRLGEVVAPEFVTLRDSPANDSVANRIFDDEGVPTGETVIINRGVLETFLHNTSTARMFEAETSGNAGLVVPEAWNLELDPGNQSKDEL